MSHLTFESLSCKLLNFDSAKPHASHQVAIPNTIELKHIVMCSQELLRHFWSSHGDRRIKIQESLKQMKIKIVAFERQYSGHVLLYIRAAITSSTNAIDAALKSQT